jgi:hypothetical protein
MAEKQMNSAGACPISSRRRQATFVFDPPSPRGIVFYVNIKDRNAACLSGAHGDQFGVAMREKPVYFNWIGRSVVKTFAALIFRPARHFPRRSAWENVIAAVFGEVFCDGC